MGTKLTPGITNCHANALLDEPMITFLARDPDMPETIRYWRTLREARIGRGEKPQSDHAMLAEALECATDATIWREENRMVTIPQTMFGVEVDPFVGARWHFEAPPGDDDMHVALTAEVARLRNALAARGAELGAAHATIASLTQDDGETDNVHQNRENRRTLRESRAALVELSERFDTQSAELKTIGFEAERQKNRAEAAEHELEAYRTEARDRMLREIGNSFHLDFNRLGVIINILGPQGCGKATLAEVLRDILVNDERVETYSAALYCQTRQTHQIHDEYGIGRLELAWEHDTRVYSMAVADFPHIRAVYLGDVDITDKVRFVTTPSMASTVKQDMFDAMREDLHPSWFSGPLAETFDSHRYMKGDIDPTIEKVTRIVRDNLGEVVGARKVAMAPELGMPYGGPSARDMDRADPYAEFAATLPLVGKWPTAEQMVNDTRKVAGISTAARSAIIAAFTSLGCVDLSAMSQEPELWADFHVLVRQIELDHRCDLGRQQQP